MTRKRDRFFALFGAALFLISAVAVSVAVIIQMVIDHNQTKGDTANTAQTQAKSSQGTKLTGFTPIAKIDKLKVIDTKVGTGDEAKAGDTVSVDYTGAIASTGVIFQSSLDTGQPVSLSLAQVIKGWQDGIPGMKVGGERRLLIPAAEAYGANPPQGSGIPANADLVFDITLHSVTK